MTADQAQLRAMYESQDGTAHALAWQFAPCDRELREDLYQEAMLDWWRRLPDWDSERANLNTFARQVMSSRIRHYLRKLRGSPTDQAGNRPRDYCFSDFPNPPEASYAPDLPLVLLDFQRLLSQCSDRDRIVGERVLIAGEQCNTVADVLGLRPSHVVKIKNALIKRCRRLYELSE